MLLVFIKALSTLQLNFQIGKKAFNLTEDVYFLVSKRLVNKNCLSVFDHFVKLALKGLRRLYKEFGKVSSNICKIFLLNSPNFFLVKLPSLKVYQYFLGKRRQRHTHTLVKQLRWSFCGNSFRWILAVN